MKLFEDEPLDTEQHEFDIESDQCLKCQRFEDCRVLNKLPDTITTREELVVILKILHYKPEEMDKVWIQVALGTYLLGRAPSKEGVITGCMLYAKRHPEVLDFTRTRRAYDFVMPAPEMEM